MGLIYLSCYNKCTDRCQCREEMSLSKMNIEIPLSYTLQCATFRFGLWWPTHITAEMLFVVLVSNAFSSWNYVASNGKGSVNDELGRIWKEAVVASFELRSPHVPLGPRKTKKNQSGQVFSAPICESMSSRVHSGRFKLCGGGGGSQ